MLTDVPVRGVRERLLTLRSLPNMTGLDDDGFEMLASHTIERYVRKGEHLLRENEPMQSAFVVVDGMVHCRRQGFVTARVDKGGVGFLSVLARDPIGIEAVAIEDSHVLEFPVEFLFDAYEENFSFLRNAIRLLAGGMLAKRDALPRRADEGDVEIGEWFDRPRTLVENILQARSNPGVLAHVNLDAVIDWARMQKEVRAEPGHVFWRAGDRGTHSMFIQYGRVRCTAPDGRSTLVGATFVMGALDPMCERPRAYDAVAETRFIGSMQGSDDWMSLVESHRDLGMELLAVLAKQLLHLQLEDAKKSG